jgi:hypothetical protein
MKCIGGPGNGIFECVQDIVGYTNLCYIAVDDPDLYGMFLIKLEMLFFLFGSALFPVSVMTWVLKLPPFSTRKISGSTLFLNIGGL